MILLVDNFDSFVHNLARYLEELGETTLVRRSHQLSLDEVERLRPRAVVISPGPCDPARAGVSVPLVERFSGRIPILGICLGHQAIAHALGGKVVRALEPVHGTASPIYHDGRGIFDGLPSPFQAGRYHSLVVREADLPARLRVTATTPDGKGGRVIMALEEVKAPTIGLQFHPESILTEYGHRLLSNFLRIAGSAATPGEGELEPGAAPPLSAAVEASPPEESARCASEGGAARAGLAADRRAPGSVAGEFVS